MMQEKKAGRKLIAAVIAAALLVCVFPTVAYADNDKISELEEKIKQTQEEKEETEGKIDESKNELENLQNTTEGLKGQLNNLNSDLTQISENLAQLEEQISLKNAEIEKTNQELDEARQTEASQYAAMKKRVQFMYEKRDFILMEMLFSSANFADLLNRSDYIEKLVDLDLGHIFRRRDYGLNIFVVFNGLFHISFPPSISSKCFWLFCRDSRTSSSSSSP